MDSTRCGKRRSERGHTVVACADRREREHVQGERRPKQEGLCDRLDTSVAKRTLSEAERDQHIGLRPESTGLDLSRGHCLSLCKLVR